MEGCADAVEKLGETNTISEEVHFMLSVSPASASSYKSGSKASLAEMARNLGLESMAEETLTPVINATL